MTEPRVKIEVIEQEDKVIVNIGNALVAEDNIKIELPPTEAAIFAMSILRVVGNIDGRVPSGQ
jgi:hypothetical protein